MDDAMAELIALLAGAIIVFILMTCRNLNLESLDKTAMALINSAKEFLYGEEGQVLKEENEDLYLDCLNAIRECEYLLTSEDMKLVECLRAILAYSALFEEAREAYLTAESLRKQ